VGKGILNENRKRKFKSVIGLGRSGLGSGGTTISNRFAYGRKKEGNCKPYVGRSLSRGDRSKNTERRDFCSLTRRERTSCREERKDKGEGALTGV